MFWAWFEDLIEVCKWLMINKTTIDMQREHAGSLFFHSIEWLIFAYYLDDVDY